jgi:prolyl oligopeptidase
MLTELGAIPNVVEAIHGVLVADPYRWLEDRTSAETDSWIAGQRTHFDDYFRGLGSLDRLRSRVRDFADVETIDQVGKIRGSLFYRKRRVADQQPSIFVWESPAGPERVLVNPADQGPYASVGIHRISSDASLLAYELKQGGEHSKAIYIVDVRTGTILPDHLAPGLARGFVLRTANDGFYYSHDFVEHRLTSENNHEVLCHRLGTAVADDVVLLTLPRTRSSKLVLRSEGEKLGATLSYELAGTAVVDFYMTSQVQDNVWTRVCHNVAAPFGPFLCCGRLFAHRFQNAPNGEIVELDPTDGLPSRVIVPEWDVPSQQCICAHDRFYLSYLIGTEAVVRIWSLEGDYLGTLPLDKGHTWRLLPKYTNGTDEFFLQCESFVRPPTLFCCQPRTNELTVWSQRHAPAPANSVQHCKVTYRSFDDTEITMSLVGMENLPCRSGRPLIMTAYGGFGLTMTPQYSTFLSVMLELGFLFALPEIRGGGEHGPQWHEAARRRNRQVAFDDFIAAAEWLCRNDITTPETLAIFGGSNSGILVGAAITQRPDLFRAALCIAPLLDMVRYHLFDHASVWASEYGTAEDPEDFRALLAYSPYHHVREDINYPAVLFVCGDRDTRCNPAHARKMAARLHDRTVQKRAILIDHSAERGHSPTMPLSVRVDGLTHRIAFLCHELGVDIPEEMRA